MTHTGIGFHSELFLPPRAHNARLKLNHSAQSQASPFGSRRSTNSPSRSRYSGTPQSARRSDSELASESEVAWLLVPLVPELECMGWASFLPSFLFLFLPKGLEFAFLYLKRNSGVEVVGLASVWCGFAGES